MCDWRAPRSAWLLAKYLLDQGCMGTCISLLPSPKSRAGHRHAHADAGCVASAFTTNEV